MRPVPFQLQNLLIDLWLLLCVCVRGREFCSVEKHGKRENKREKNCKKFGVVTYRINERNAKLTRAYIELERYIWQAIGDVCQHVKDLRFTISFKPAPPAAGTLKNPQTILQAYKFTIRFQKFTINVHIYIDLWRKCLLYC